MRYLLLSTLLVGTAFAQEETPSQSVKPTATKPQVARQKPRPKLDPNAQQITIEVRCLSGSTEHFQKLTGSDLIRTAPIEQKPVLPQSSYQQLRDNGGIQLVSSKCVVHERQPVFVRRLNDTAVRKMIRAAQADERSNIFFAPKVTLFDGQVANISDTVQRPFVVGIQAKGTGLQPRVDILSEGMSIELRAKTIGAEVKLDVAIDLSDISNVKTRVAGPENAMVQVPEVSSSLVSLSALVRENETLAVQGLRQTREVRKEVRKFGVFKNVSLGRESEEIFILLTPRVVQPEKQTAGRVALNDNTAKRTE